MYICMSVLMYTSLSCREGRGRRGRKARRKGKGRRRRAKRERKREKRAREMRSVSYRCGKHTGPLVVMGTDISVCPRGRIKG